MADEDLHEVVDVEKIEPVSVHIEERGSGALADAGLEPRKRYTVTYSLPIAVSPAWQKNVFTGVTCRNDNKN